MAEKKIYEQPKFEVVEPDEGNGANTRLPYGIAKGLGLSTEGMTPRQVWEMLKKRGVNPENEYEKLKEKATEEIKEDKYKEVDASSFNSVNISPELQKSLPKEVYEEQTAKIGELIKEFSVFAEDDKLNVKVGSMSGGTVAKASYSPSTGSISLVFGRNFATDLNSVERNVQSGWWCDVAPESYKYQTVSHEFGHCIEYSYLKKQNLSGYAQRKIDELREEARYDFFKQAELNRKIGKVYDDARFDLFYSKVFPEIFKTANRYDSSIGTPKVGKRGYLTAPKISQYGASSWGEYFAECFANGVCGKANALGKATVEVVKRLQKGEIL